MLTLIGDCITVMSWFFTISAVTNDFTAQPISYGLNHLGEVVLLQVHHLVSRLSRQLLVMRQGLLTHHERLVEAIPGHSKALEMVHVGTFV